MEGSSLRFAEAARTLADRARALGLVAPSYRSPPRIAGDRSIRRRAGGGATVAVRYRDRPWPAVVSDMIEGVIATNGLDGLDADGSRRDLWAVMAPGVAPGDPAATALRPETAGGPTGGLRAVA